MAEPEKTEKAKTTETPLPEAKGKLAKFMPMLIVGGAVVLFATAGFVVGRSFGTRGQAQNVAAASTPEKKEASSEKKKGEGESEGKKGEDWFYEIEPVVANLNDPGVTRYVRITLTLEIAGEWPEEEGKLLLEQKKPLLKHWLTLYLTNQTLEETRGKTNLIRMQSNINEIFNQGLFPNEKPRISNVLFKEFAIQ